MGKTLLAALLALSAFPASAALTGTTIVKPRSSGTITLIPLVGGTVGTADTIYNRAEWVGTDWRTNAGIAPACFSPDGRRIAFAKGEWLGPWDSRRTMVYTMSNDASHIDTICLTENPSASGMWMSWTSTGYLYWSEGCDRVYRASLATKQSEVVASLDDFTGPKPDPLRIDALEVSLDGTRAGFMLCGVGHCMSLDFTTMLSRDYGSGCQGTASPNGLMVTHSYSGLIPGYSFHQVGTIQDFETKAVLDTFFAPGAVPNGTGALPRIVDIRFSHSSNTHVVFSGEDALDQNGYVHDLAVNQTQYLGKCQPSDFWAGALPSAAAPFIALSPASLTFNSPTGSAPPSQAVTASNSGSGSLGTLTATVSPASATWLSPSVNGMTITNTATPGSLARGTYIAFVAVSAGNSLNTAVYAVILNVSSSLVAPSALTAGKIWHGTGEPQSCVGLAWRDNSANETGFVVERAPEGGAFTRIATVAANTTRYADTVPAAGVYVYRVLAVSAADSSGYSNTVTARVSFPATVTVLAPTAGTVWQAGSTQYIRWTTDGVPNVQIKYSVNDGQDWLLITGTGSISRDSATWGNLPWVVPNLDQDSVVVRVEEYGNPSLGGESGYFTIGPSTAAAERARVLPARTGLRSGGTFVLRGTAHFAYDLAAGDQADLLICRLDGSRVATLALSGAAGSHTAVWSGRDAEGRQSPTGLYLARFVKR